MRLPTDKEVAKYGITAATYRAILRAQNGRCAVCGRAPKSKRLAVDHEHKSGRVRGALDFRCNKFIVGRHKDGRLLRAAADYLDSMIDWRKHKA